MLYLRGGQVLGGGEGDIRAGLTAREALAEAWLVGVHLLRVARVGRGVPVVLHVHPGLATHQVVTVVFIDALWGMGNTYNSRGSVVIYLIISLNDLLGLQRQTNCLLLSNVFVSTLMYCITVFGVLRLFI